MLSIPRTPKCDDTNVTLNTPKKNFPHPTIEALIVLLMIEPGTHE
jgi:hypothetical protein